MTKRHLGILALSSLACLTVAQAQTSATTGAVRGIIASKGGKLLAGATVTVRNQENGFTRTSVTNDKGEYGVGLLLVGNYELTVTAKGMRTLKNGAILVSLGKTTPVNFTMDSAEASATVEVVGVDNFIDRTNVSNSVSIDQKLVEAVPLNGRNFTDLMKLTPGAANDSANGAAHEFMGGGRDIYNNLTIDGASNNSSFYGGVRGSTSTPFAFGLDTIKELQVITDPFDPMYGNAAGGVINAVTKTGGNEIEGSALIQLRPSSLVARRRATPYDSSVGGINNSTAARTRDFSQQQYNFNVGGPIIPDKLFYFVGMETYHYTQNSTASAQTSGSNPIADLNTFMSNFGNLVVGNGGDTLGAENGRGTTQDKKNTAVFVRLDWNINENHRMDLRMNSQEFTNRNGSITSSPSTAFSDNGTDYYNDISWVLELNSTFGANMSNEARFQYATERRPRTPNSTASPEFSISGGFTAGQIWYEPSNLNEFTKQFIDTFSLIQDDWTYKAGVDLQWFKYQNQFPQDMAGFYSFSDYAAANAWAAGQALPNGQTETYTGSVSPTNGWIDYTSSLLTGFLSVNNSGLLNQKLNVTAGLRITRENAANNPLPKAALAGTDSPDSQTNVDPRFAFTYDLTGHGNTLIKGGYGWFSSPNPSLTVSNTMTANGNTISVYSISNTMGKTGVDTSSTSVQAAWAPAGILGYNQAVVNHTLVPLSATQLQAFPAGTLTGQLWDPSNKLPMVKRSSLGIEQKLPHDLVVGARVEYAEFSHEQYFVNANLNQVEADGSLAGYNNGYASALNTFKTSPRPTSIVVDGRTINTSGFGNMFLSENNGIGRYKALIFTAARHSEGGFGFQSSVTFANQVDMNSNERITNGGISVENNPANPRANMSAGDADVRFRGVFAAYFPIYWGIKGVTTLTYQSGMPYSAMAATDVNGDGNSSNDYAPGYGGRNAYRQPGAKTCDFRLSRNFNIYKKLEVETSLDIYNLFNWANWTTSQTTPLSSTGVANAHFGALDIADNQTREVQFGVRLKF